MMNCFLFCCLHYSRLIASLVVTTILEMNDLLSSILSYIYKDYSQAILITLLNLIMMIKSFNFKILILKY